MPVFSIPLSGLTASSNALSVIANNLANLNTVAYKDQRVTFRDLFYQTVGSNGAGNPLQLGAGTNVNAILSNFNDGNTETTGVPTDVAITGDGFFVVQQDGALRFTRAGNFTVNAAGQLTTQGGQLVLGYPAVNGAITGGQALAPIQLGKGQTSAPVGTSSMQMRTNLDASATIGATYSTPITIYDSLGTSHVLTFDFTKAAANEWDYSIRIPASEVGASGTSVTIRTGQLRFDGSGRLTSPASDVTGISVSGFSDGASNLTFDWKLLDANGVPMFTQTAAKSATASTYQDGYPSGTLAAYAIAQDGTIQGAFSNGRTMALAQLALANFANLQGLERSGDNTYLATLSSGGAVIGAPGTGGRGLVSGGALELSNVDIAQEFSKMILTQRGYQANARVVTTFDEITQDTINLKR